MERKSFKHIVQNEHILFDGQDYVTLNYSSRHEITISKESVSMKGITYYKVKRSI